MNPHTLLLCIAILFVQVFPAEIDYCASAPFQYNHKTGGGAYNDRTIGRFKDVVESLEIGDFQCGDIVSFLMAITWTRQDTSMKVQQEYLADTTGQSGVAFGKLINVSIHTNDYLAENGNGGSGEGGGLGVFRRDGYVNQNKPVTVTYTSNLVGTKFTFKALLLVDFEVKGLSMNDKVVIRTDVLLECDGRRPTGNLQGQILSATTGSGTTINVGMQTVPLKTKGFQPPCTPDPNSFKGVDFEADVEISTTTGAMNDGSSTGTYTYSWSAGVYSTVASVGRSSKRIHKFDVKCDKMHKSYAAYNLGGCGCEVTNVETTQPQLFFDPAGNYYNPTFTTLTLDGVTVKKYTRLVTPATEGVTALYLHDTTNAIVRADFVDGTIIKFTRVVYKPITQKTIEEPLDLAVSSATSCVCRRPADIALLVQLTADTTADAYTASRSFGIALANEFSVSSKTTAISILSYDSKASLGLPLSDGVLINNVIAAINSLPCTATDKKNSNKCGNAQNGGALGAGLLLAVNQLKASPRFGKVPAHLVVVTSNWLSADAGVQQALKAASDAKIAVIVVSYASAAAAPAGVTSILRQSVNDLSGGNIQDVSGLICSQSASPCGALCCGTCDATCGTCQSIDKCPESTNCTHRYTIQGGCCQKTFTTASCPPKDCQTATCDAVSGQCTYAPLCQAPANDQCYTYTCAANKCVSSFTAVAANNCETLSCVGGMVVRNTTCPPNDMCFTYTCSASGACVPTPVPTTVVAAKCQKITCDPVKGYTATAIEGCSITTTCPANVGCTIYTVNSTNQCEPSAPCPNPGPCFTTTCVVTNNRPSCINTAIDCNDNNPCTVDTCSNGKCVNTEIVCSSGDDLCKVSTCNKLTGKCEATLTLCDDNIPCTKDTCSPTTGKCVFTPSDQECRSADPCVLGRCDPVAGCVQQNATCPDSGSFCLIPGCRAFDGCFNSSRACKPQSAPKDDNDCMIARCDAGAAQCVDEHRECNSFLGAIVGASVSAAAVAGIVAAAIVGVGASGGGVFAAVNRAGAGAHAVTVNNPIYKDSNIGGTNPMHRI